MVKGRQLMRLRSVLNLTDPCLQYCASTTIEGCQAGRLGHLFQHMREYIAESPKLDSKRFNSQGRLNSLPIWVYNLSMMLVNKVHMSRRNGFESPAVQYVILYLQAPENMYKKNSSGKYNSVGLCKKNLKFGNGA